MVAKKENSLRKMSKKEEKAAESLTKELLILLGEKEAKLKVASGEEKELIISINSQEPEFLIGHHGKTIEALQLLIKLMIFSKLEEWRPVVVNVNDYREKQKERIVGLAQKAAMEVEVSKRPVYLPPMSAYERRLAHLALADHPSAGSISEGVGESRRVVVKPR